MSTVSPSTNDLIEQNQGLVRSIATRVRRSLPSNIELDDLIGYGQLGLAEAAQNFDPQKGCSFTTYAYYRVRGAIYDGVSKLAWTSRARYHHIRYEQMANATLESEAEQQPESSRQGSLTEMAARFGDVAEKLAVVYLGSLGDGESRETNLQVADSSVAEPSDLAARRELCDRLRGLVDSLPEQAATLIRATYYEGLTLKQAGARLGVSKSRASRVHASAIQRLARSLKRMGIED